MTIKTPTKRNLQNTKMNYGALLFTAMINKCKKTKRVKSNFQDTQFRQNLSFFAKFQAKVDINKKTFA